MKLTTFILGMAAAALTNWQAGAQIYDSNNVMVGTFAGYGIAGYHDGQGLFTEFNAPNQIVSDTASNLYVLDGGNHLIRKITPGATVTTLVGGGSLLEGYGTNVSLTWGTTSSMAIDHNNTIWLVMYGGYYSGLPYLVTINTNGYVSIQNGGLTNLTSSSGLCFDSFNNLYYSGGNYIYRYHPNSGGSEIIAGTGTPGYADGPGPIFSQFSYPTALACDQANNIYVWDTYNSLIRRIDPLGNVTTIAGGAGSGNNRGWPDGNGTNAYFSGTYSMFSDNNGNIYFVSPTNVRKMDAQTNVDTLAGVVQSYYGQPSYVDGQGSVARFNNASSGCIVGGTIFIADSGNNRIRNITFNQSPAQVAPANVQLQTCASLQITGTIGKTYQIQSSPDLNMWTTTATVLLNASPYTWVDLNPVAGSKYYRVLMLP